MHTTIELIWHTVLGVLAFAVIGVLVTLIVSEKHVVGYYLSSGPSTIATSLYIGVDIEWADDECVPLVGVSYSDAVDLVARLNRELVESRRTP